MKKLILCTGLSAVLAAALSACGSGAALPFTDMVFGGEGSDSRELPETEEQPGWYDELAKPLPTDRSGAESPAEKREEALPDASQPPGEASCVPEETSPVLEGTSPALEGTSPAPEEGVRTITISAAGDCSLGNHQDQEYAYSFRQVYDQIEDEGYFFANVQEYFAEDDLTIVNFEGVLTYSEERDETRTYNIKGDPGYARLLTAGHIEAVSFANNHRLDYGTRGSEDTVAALEAEGILYAYDKNVCVYDTEEGIRVGVVSVNELAWGLGSEKLLKEGIEKLREQGADLILACCHWGIERENYPTENQRYLGRKCVELGADLVIGHHPHVLQGVEEYNGKFIIYSLANFCFGANRNPADKDTMIFQQTFTFIDGVKQQDRQARVIPCSVSSVKDRNNFQPTPAQGEEAARIIGRINTYSIEFGVAFAEDGTLAY